LQTLAAPVRGGELLSQLAAHQNAGKSLFEPVLSELRRSRFLILLNADAAFFQHPARSFYTLRYSRRRRSVARPLMTARNSFFQQRIGRRPTPRSG